MLKVLKFSRLFLSKSRPLLQSDFIKLSAQCERSVKKFHHSNCCRSKNDDTNSKVENVTDVTPTIASKYELFSDNNATIILDIEEERDKMLVGEMETEEIVDTTPSIFKGLNTEHGKTGVFDIEDLIELLKRDNAENVFVCTVPKELKYVDYLVVITARSTRHMKAMAEIVRKMFKIKRRPRELVPRIEGKNSNEWMALDLGNIALHIFSSKVRKQYDIEMLWSVGPKYDTETNKPNEPIVDLFDQHTLIFDPSQSDSNQSTNLSSSENTIDLRNKSNHTNNSKANQLKEK